MMIALSIKQCWQKYSTDIKNAFVNEALREAIYVAQPEGFIMKGFEDYIYRLHCVQAKRFMVFKQASRDLLTHLNILLNEMACKCSNADMTLYLLRNGKEFLFKLVYIDKIVMLANEQSMISMVIKKFKTKIKVGISTNDDQLLGISIDDEGNIVKVPNTTMIERGLDHFKMGDCEPVFTPLPTRLDMSSEIEDILHDLTPYRQSVDGLMHLDNTVRSDTSFAVHYLPRFMHYSLMKGLWTAGKHIFRFLKGKKSLEIIYQHGND